MSSFYLRFVTHLMESFLKKTHSYTSSEWMCAMFCTKFESRIKLTDWMNGKVTSYQNVMTMKQGTKGERWMRIATDTSIDNDTETHMCVCCTICRSSWHIVAVTYINTRLLMATSKNHIQMWLDAYALLMLMHWMWKILLYFIN